MKLIIILFLLFSFCRSGPGYPACILACELACCGTMIIPVLLPIYLQCAATCPAACLASCFPDNTTFMIMESNMEIPKLVQDIKIGDYIMSKNDDGKNEITKVIKNEKYVGHFRFAKFITNQNELTVTIDHGVIIYDNLNIYITSAKNVKVGHLLLTKNNTFEEIVNIEIIDLNEKYNLQVESGIVITNSIITSTICREELEGDVFYLYKNKIDEWRHKHKF